MPIVAATTVIRAPRADVYDISQDYHMRLNWDPFVREIAFLDGAVETAPGVKVWVKAKNRLTMVAEYISVNKPERVAVRMVEGPWFLANFAGTWVFAAVERDLTEVRFRYSFALRPRFLRWPGDALVRAVFRADLQARLRGLKRYAEAQARADTRT
ncbi:MAG: SRPBCC family protein [Proteobacteria bacterium]|nr:SRPBCC family protein [Pseudomonadota bacterium]